VDPLVTYEPLARQLAALGAEQVIKALASYDDLLRHAVPQDERLATNAPKIGSHHLEFFFDSLFITYIPQMGRWRRCAGKSTNRATSTTCGELLGTH